MAFVYSYEKKGLGPLGLDRTKTVVTFERFYEWARNHLSEITTLLHTFQLVSTPDKEKQICENILSTLEIAPEEESKAKSATDDKEK